MASNIKICINNLFFKKSYEFFFRQTDECLTIKVLVYKNKHSNK